MEKLTKEEINKKGIIWGIINIIVFFFFSIFPYFFEIKNIKIEYLLCLISYLIIVLISLIIFKKRLKRDFSYYKDHFKEYLGFILKSQCLMFFIYLLITYLSTILLNSTDTSLNQQEIESLPVYMIILTSIIYAPISEELVFRGSIRRFIKKDWLFIIISGCIFGFLHTMAEPTFIESLIRGLPYVWVGIYFAYMYTKTENIMVPITCHFLHNAFAVLILLLSGII